MTHTNMCLPYLVDLLNITVHNVVFWMQIAPAILGFLLWVSVNFLWVWGGNKIEGGPSIVFMAILVGVIPLTAPGSLVVVGILLGIILAILFLSCIVWGLNGIGKSRAAKLNKKWGSGESQGGY